jgi:hypothetical protein
VYFSNGILFGVTDSGGIDRFFRFRFGFTANKKPPGPEAQEAVGEHGRVFASSKEQDPGQNLHGGRRVHGRSIVA